MNFLLKHRLQILAFLILLEAGVTVTSIFDAVPDDIVFDYVESVIIILILGFTYFISNNYIKLEYQNEVSKALFSSSGEKYIFYDAKKQKIVISPNFSRILGIAAKETYEIDEIEYIFGDEWKAVSACFEPNSYQNIKVVGRLSDKISDRIFSYTVDYINASKGDIFGVVIWFRDITEDVQSNNSLIELVNKYRNISYELELFLNSLPNPIWVKNNYSELVFINKEFIKFQTQYGKENIDSMVLGFGSNEVADKKLFLRNGRRENVKFNQLKCLNEQFWIGYIQNLNEYEDLERQYRNLNHTIEKILEISDLGIISLDANGELKNANLKFAEMFLLDYDWLEGKPSFSQVLDKMREKGSLPEMRDYNEFKASQLQLLTLIVPVVDYFYLVSDATIKYSVIPVDANSTLIVYSDISDDLKLERSHEMMGSIINELIGLSPYPIIIFSRNGRVRLVNKIALEFLGLDSLTIIDNLDLKFIASSVKGFSKQQIARVEKFIIASFHENGCRELELAADRKVVVKPLQEYGVLVAYI